MPKKASGVRLMSTLPGAAFRSHGGGFVVAGRSMTGGRTQLRDFAKYLKKMSAVGYEWTKHGAHGKLLEDFDDVGGVNDCPPELLDEFLEWLILAYIGEPGGYVMGINRPVFYGNSAAPSFTA